MDRRPKESRPRSDPEMARRESGQVQSIGRPVHAEMAEEARFQRKGPGPVEKLVPKEQAQGGAPTLAKETWNGASGMRSMP